MTITRATAQNALVALLGVALVLHVDRRLGQLERESAQQPLSSTRRLQTAGMCTDDSLRQRAADVTTECCDEPSEDCSSGVPDSCNAGCAAIFLPFWSDCRTVMGEDTHGFDSVVELCEAGTNAVGAAGNANAFAFGSESSLYGRYLQRAAPFDYYPLPNVNDFDMAGEWADAAFAQRAWTSMSDVRIGPRANVDASSSLTAAQYYNAVVWILLRYFNFTPNADATQPWTGPPAAQICQPPMANCGEEDTATQQMQADYRIRPTICCHGTGHLDFSVLLNEYTTETTPCDFPNVNSVTTLEWTSCAERLGLSAAVLAAQAPEIQQGLDHMFDVGYGPFATGVSTAGTALAKVPATGTTQLECGIGLGFSFGVGYDCQHFASCTQPGMTNTVLAAAMLRSGAVLGCQPGVDEAPQTQVTLIAQWEVTVALALQLGVDRGSVDTTVQHPSFTAAYGHRSITVYIVGNPLATPGAYISTDGVAEQMSDIISSSGKHTLALFAHPEHLPRVYRSSIANFHGNVDATIFPAMIPYTLNWPVVGSGAIINLFADSAMMSGPNFGMYPDSAQAWVRDRSIFRLYELFTYPEGGAKDSLRHAADWYGYAENQPPPPPPPDPCLSAPCANGGVCTAAAGGSGHRRVQGEVEVNVVAFSCSCSGGWGGSLCEVADDPCMMPVTVECGAHGSCSGGVCVCTERYQGIHCEEKPLPCCTTQGCASCNDCGQFGCLCSQLQCADGTCLAYAIPMCDRLHGRDWSDRLWGPTGRGACDRTC